MITTDAYNHRIAEYTYSGAAARKMTLVTRAARSAGLKMVIVSLPFLGKQVSKTSYRRVVLKDRGVPFVFLATLRSPILRKLLSPFTLAAFALKRVNREDTVIFYNHAIEYIPALLVLWLRGVKLVLDIEDVPTVEEKGIRGFLNRILFAITFHMTDDKKMVVAEHVARLLALQDHVVIRGVAEERPRIPFQPDHQKWQSLIDGNGLRIHFGGTLIPDTGIDLFCNTIDLLIKNQDKLRQSVTFVVTGTGELEKIEQILGSGNSRDKIRIDLFPQLNQEEYLQMIDSCHASLSLKRPESGIAGTTFPSKVIEITSSHLALVSTRFGDVSDLFDEQTAFLLPDFSAADLEAIIIEMTKDPARVNRIAESGFALCNKTFSEAVVGREMTRLV